MKLITSPSSAFFFSSVVPKTVNVHASLFSSRQPAPTNEKLGSFIAAYSSWKLAAFERAVYTTKSFLLALALVEGRLTVEECALASQVEVDSQIRLWGEVEDSESSLCLFF